MFRESATARYILRAIVAATLAGLAAAATALSDNGITALEYVLIASSVFGSFGAYLGIGAATPQAEPFVGKKLDNAQVPVPPAEPERAGGI